MRNQDAARYARWAAIVAVVIALVVAGAYIRRAERQARARRAEPPVIPKAVEQQSSLFSLRSGEKGRTIFEIQASRATRYKAGERAVLQNVVITIHGYKVDRNDTIETQECGYDPGSGAVSCAGPVRIDLRPAVAGNRAQSGAATKAIEIETSDLSFNSKTGDAFTPAAVQFSFPQGTGHGTGITYSSRTAVLRVQRDVEFDLSPSRRTGGAPVRATGSALEMRRDQRTIQLFGPVDVRQGGRELTARNVLLELDKDFHARHVTAEGHPEIRSTENAKTLAFSAGRLEALLSAEGWIQSIAGDGDIAGMRRTKDATERVSAANVQVVMLPRGNFAQTMTASGSVVATSNRDGATQSLRTEALRLSFAPPTGRPSPESKHARPQADGIETQQQIESAETLGPASIETTSSGNKGTQQLHANQFVARFGSDGRMQTLLGHGDVEVRQQAGTKPVQVSTAPELEASFGGNGQLAGLVESGGVRVQQGGQEATSARLTFAASPSGEVHGAKSARGEALAAKPAGVVTLEGAPVLADSESRTTVGGQVTIETGDQSAEKFRATGGVISTYLPAAQAAGPMKLGSGAAHVFADTLSGSASSGHLIYEGHARVWQGDAVLDADRIEVWRDEKKMQAIGSVAAVFTQAAGPLGGFPDLARSKSAQAVPGKTPSAARSGAAQSAGPAVWQVRAPSFTYWSDQGKIRLEGGVTAQSQDNSIQSNTLDAFLVPATHSGISTARQAAARPGQAAVPPPSGAQQIGRILAQGGVVVHQGDRRGTAEQAEYTASDGKFVLSGGQPMLADADGNSVTGRSLTFFLADDTILIDSQAGSRTLTKHRVEK